jgi:hypothetical protein
MGRQLAEATLSVLFEHWWRHNPQKIGFQRHVGGEVRAIDFVSLKFGYALELP